MKPIIEVSKMDADYYTCNACTGKDDVKQISVGYTIGNGGHTQSIRLCKACRKVLKKLL